MMELDGAAVSAEDMRALGLINYGHFTSMQVEGTQVRGLGRHLTRLVEDCRTLFDAELDRQRVRRLTRRVAQAADTPAILRVTAFDPDLNLAHPGAPAEPRVLVTVRSGTSGPLRPLRLRSTTYVRELPQVKHVGLFGTIHHRRSAQLAGYDDALFCDADGEVSEGTTWNIAFVVDGRIVWPQADHLPGVTMRLLDEAAHSLGIPTRIAPVHLASLADVAAAFVTNAAVGIRPVYSIDDVALPGSESMLRALGQAYGAIEPEGL